MARELSGHAAAEGLYGPLHELPHLRADREVDLRYRRMDHRSPAHGQLRARNHSAGAAEAQGNARGNESGAVAAARRIPSFNQSERNAAMGVSAQDVASPQGPFDQSRHHRVRPAALNRDAA